MLGVVNDSLDADDPEDSPARDEADEEEREGAVPADPVTVTATEETPVELAGTLRPTDFLPTFTPSSPPVPTSRTLSMPPTRSITSCRRE